MSRHKEHRPNGAAAEGGTSVFFWSQNLVVGLLDAKPCRTITKLPQKVSLGSGTRKIGRKVWFLASGSVSLGWGNPHGGSHLMNIPVAIVRSKIGTFFFHSFLQGPLESVSATMP